MKKPIQTYVSEWIQKRFPTQVTKERDDLGRAYVFVAPWLLLLTIVMTVASGSWKGTLLCSAFCAVAAVAGLWVKRFYPNSKSCRIWI